MPSSAHVSWLKLHFFGCHIIMCFDVFDSLKKNLPMLSVVIIVSCDTYPQAEPLQLIVGFPHLLNPTSTPNCTHASVYLWMQSQKSVYSDILIIYHYINIAWGSLSTKRAAWNVLQRATFNFLTQNTFQSSHFFTLEAESVIHLLLEYF